MPVNKIQDTIFNQMMNPKNKSSTYNYFNNNKKAIVEQFTQNTNTAIDLPMPPLNEYDLDSSGNIIDQYGNKHTKCFLKNDIKKKLALYTKHFDAVPDSEQSMIFNLNKGNNIVFNPKDGSDPITYDFAIFDQSADPEAPDMGDTEGVFETNFKTIKYPNGNLIGLLDLARADTKTVVDGEDKYVFGDVTTYECNLPHAHRDCQVTYVNDQYKCVCSNTEKIGDGKSYHTHCEEDISGQSSINSLISKFNTIKIEGQREDDPSIYASTNYYPKTTDLVELISDYYISLLHNKKKFEKLEELKQVVVNTSQYHKDSNIQYKGEFIGIVNISIGIVLSLGLLYGFSRK